MRSNRRELFTRVYLVKYAWTILKNNMCLMYIMNNFDSSQYTNSMFDTPVKNAFNKLESDITHIPDDNYDIQKINFEPALSTQIENAANGLGTVNGNTLSITKDNAKLMLNVLRPNITGGARKSKRRNNKRRNSKSKSRRVQKRKNNKSKRRKM